MATYCQVHGLILSHVYVYSREPLEPEYSVALSATTQYRSYNYRSRPYVLRKSQYN